MVSAKCGPQEACYYVTSSNNVVIDDGGDGDAYSTRVLNLFLRFLVLPGIKGKPPPTPSLHVLENLITTQK